MPANFKSAIFLLLKGMAGYEETVRMGIASGTDVCGVSCIVASGNLVRISESTVVLSK